ncbi:MAG: AAA family ATPase [Methanothrix sp.]|jgi:dephospho-CoA kinase|uniref:AAA family ATPase n=1 Tax=Methanothrix sp. TaxID=90426 RepID=UPI0025DDCDC2|nr:AAA family ATPase [Methanothrix sp.]HPW72469.1 AAA family ATPase [Methanothrix sp.]
MRDEERMKIIGFVGLPGSGKGEASRIARERGLVVVVMGDVIRQEAARQGLEPTDQNLGRIGNALREREGPEAVAKRTLEMAQRTGRDLVVVDGLRSQAEADFFRSRAEEFYLIEVQAAADVRLRWLENRGRPDDPKGCEEDRGGASAEAWAVDSAASALKEREGREKGWGLCQAMERADYRIDNSGSLEDLRQRVVQLLDRITADGGKN